jgi:anti-sigma factor RsiW
MTSFNDYPIDEARMLLAGYLEGRLTSDQVAVVQSWLEFSPQARHELTALKRLMTGLRKDPTVFCPETWQLSVYADAGIDPTGEIKRHLKSCSRCRTELDELVAAGSSKFMPESLFQRVRREVPVTVPTDTEAQDTGFGRSVRTTIPEVLNRIVSGLKTVRLGTIPTAAVSAAVVVLIGAAVLLVTAQYTDWTREARERYVPDRPEVSDEHRMSAEEIHQIPSATPSDRSEARMAQAPAAEYSEEPTTSPYVAGPGVNTSSQGMPSETDVIGVIEGGGAGHGQEEVPEPSGSGRAPGFGPVAGTGASESYTEILSAVRSAVRDDSGTATIDLLKLLNEKSSRLSPNELRAIADKIEAEMEEPQAQSLPDSIKQVLKSVSNAGDSGSAEAVLQHVKASLELMRRRFESIDAILE